tara:strand:- start:621 stop:1514 length:894 start_codon:yes stop_codon:yes gene_type:complete
MIDIGIVGSGNWATTIIKEINNNKKFNLTSVVCRNNKKFDSKLIIFNSVNKFIESNINKTIYVAAHPNLNLEIIKLIKDKNISLILEKPTSDSLKNLEELQRIVKKNKLIVFPNLTNYFSETFVKLESLIKNNYKNISEIILCEGGYGPFRKNIHPIWDWGYHCISLLYLLFEKEHFSKISERIIILKKTKEQGNVTKFNLKINNKIKVKIITGNLFKKKLRKIKIKMKNGDYIVNDMIAHKLYFNNKIIFENMKTPITSLLDNFEIAIRLRKYDTSKRLIDASLNTTKFLEKFYKC